MNNIHLGRSYCMEPFETKRLLLRPLKESDLRDLFLLYSDPVVMQFITGAPRSFEKTAQRLQAHLVDHQKFDFGLCATILKETGEMIGRCGLEPVETLRGIEGDIAWMFKQAYWGQGLATEVGDAFIRFGFVELKLKRIFGTANHRNLRSIAVMQKLGLRFVNSTERGVEYEILAGNNFTEGIILCRQNSTL